MPDACKQSVPGEGLMTYVSEQDEDASVLSARGGAWKGGHEGISENVLRADYAHGVRHLVREHFELTASGELGVDAGYFQRTR